MSSDGKGIEAEVQKNRKGGGERKKRVLNYMVAGKEKERRERRGDTGSCPR